MKNKKRQFKIQKTKIKRLFLRFRWKPVFLIVVIATIIVVTLIFAPNIRDDNTESFVSAFGNYRIVVKQYETATHLPGVSENRTRQKLNQILANVLTEDMNSGKRLEVSKEGIKLIEKLESQIDDIRQMSFLVESAITQLKKSKEEMREGDLKDKADEIIEMMLEGLDIGSDIKGLSYRANYHTAEIFKHIITDDGQLTDSYILYLNELIPEVEKQFDKRSDLYDRFENLSNKIEKQFIAFENSL